MFVFVGFVFDVSSNGLLFNVLLVILVILLESVVGVCVVMLMILVGCVD